MRYNIAPILLSLALGLGAFLFIGSVFNKIENNRQEISSLENRLEVRIDSAIAAKKTSAPTKSKERYFLIGYDAMYSSYFHTVGGMWISNLNGDMPTYKEMKRNIQDYLKSKKSKVIILSVCEFKNKDEMKATFAGDK